MVFDFENIILNIDSKFRNKTKYQNSSKFSIDLTNPLKNINSIRLSSIEFPNVFYTFSTNKNNTTFLIDNIKIEIPSGNYDANTLIQTINTIIKQLVSYISVELVLDYNTGKITIKEKDTNTFNLNFDNDTIYPSLGYLLGFRNNLYESNSLYTSESILDIIGDNYILIKINDYGNLINTFSGNKYFGKIIIYNNKNTVIFDNNSNFISKTYNFLQPVNINKLSIQLTDIYDNEIDMNQLDFSLTIEVEQIYNYETKLILEGDINYESKLTLEGDINYDNKLSLEQDINYDDNNI
jgi:hypothetical protein